MRVKRAPDTSPTVIFSDMIYPVGVPKEQMQETVSVYLSGDTQLDRQVIEMVVIPALLNLCNPPLVAPGGRFSVNRACRGMKAVHTNERHRDSKDNLGDLLLDLMHYAQQAGKDFQQELRYAFRAFTEDTKEEAS